MQLFNKEASKRIFTHTWYIYPLLIGIITVIWLWGFQAFHQPSSHQSLLMFFSTNISNNVFTKEIMNEYYAREDLRQIDAYYSLPDLPSYVDKLNLYIRKSDILVLDKKTIDDLRGYQERFFVEFDDKLKEKYFDQNYEFYTYIDSQQKEHILKLFEMIRPIEWNFYFFNFILYGYYIWEDFNRKLLFWGKLFIAQLLQK